MCVHNLLTLRDSLKVGGILVNSNLLFIFRDAPSLNSACDHDDDEEDQC